MAFVAVAGLLLASPVGLGRPHKDEEKPLAKFADNVPAETEPTPKVYDPPVHRLLDAPSTSGETAPERFGALWALRAVGPNKTEKSELAVDQAKGRDGLATPHASEKGALEALVETNSTSARLEAVAEWSVGMAQSMAALIMIMLFAALWILSPEPEAATTTTSLKEGPSESSDNSSDFRIDAVRAAMEVRAVRRVQRPTSAECNAMLAAASQNLDQANAVLARAEGPEEVARAQATKVRASRKYDKVFQKTRLSMHEVRGQDVQDEPAAGGTSAAVSLSTRAVPFSPPGSSLSAHAAPFSPQSSAGGASASSNRTPSPFKPSIPANESNDEMETRLNQEKEEILLKAAKMAVDEVTRTVEATRAPYVKTKQEVRDQAKRAQRDAQHELTRATVNLETAKAALENAAAIADAEALDKAQLHTMCAARDYDTAFEKAWVASRGVGRFTHAAWLAAEEMRVEMKQKKGHVKKEENRQLEQTKRVLVRAAAEAHAAKKAADKANAERDQFEAEQRKAAAEAEAAKKAAAEASAARDQFEAEQAKAARQAHAAKKAVIRAKMAAAEANAARDKLEAEHALAAEERRRATLRECPMCLDDLSVDGSTVHALVPCGHSLCATCAPALVGGPCPVCTQVVSTTLRVYL